MKIFLILPVFLLVAGYLLGVAQLYRTLIFFSCWIFLCVMLYVSSLMYAVSHNDPMPAILGLVLAIMLAFPSVWFATLFSFATSPRVNPAPIQKIHSAYSALDDSEKQQIHRWAKIGAKLAAKHGSTYLHSKGHNFSAGALKDASRFI